MLPALPCFLAFVMGVRDERSCVPSQLPIRAREALVNLSITSCLAAKSRTIKSFPLKHCSTCTYFVEVPLKFVLGKQFYGNTFWLILFLSTAKVG